MYEDIVGKIEDFMGVGRLCRKNREFHWCREIE